MERFTKQVDGSYIHAEGRSMNEIIQKLAKYENMYEALCTEQSKIIKEMENLRLTGKSKTVTYQQLMANKLMVMNLISRFEIYGL